MLQWIYAQDMYSYNGNRIYRSRDFGQIGRMGEGEMVLTELQSLVSPLDGGLEKDARGGKKLAVRTYHQRKHVIVPSMLLRSRQAGSHNGSSAQLCKVCQTSDGI
jgi:hypothetical protein